MKRFMFVTFLLITGLIIVVYIFPNQQVTSRERVPVSQSRSITAIDSLLISTSSAVKQIHSSVDKSISTFVERMDFQFLPDNTPKSDSGSTPGVKKYSKSRDLNTPVSDINSLIKSNSSLGFMDTSKDAIGITNLDKYIEIISDTKETSPND